MDWKFSFTDIICWGGVEQVRSLSEYPCCKFCTHLTWRRRNKTLVKEGFQIDWVTISYSSQVVCMCKEPKNFQHTHTHTNTSVIQRKTEKALGWEKKRELEFKAMVGQQQPPWLKIKVRPTTPSRTWASMDRGQYQRAEARKEGCRRQPQGQQAQVWCSNSRASQSDT